MAAHFYEFTFKDNQENFREAGTELCNAVEYLFLKINDFLQFKGINQYYFEWLQR